MTQYVGLFYNQSGTHSFVHPGVVYTQAEIDAWSTSDPEYTRLANTSTGNISSPSYPTPWVFDATMSSGGSASCTNCDMNTGFRDQSLNAKVQAVLWAADGNAARKTWVTNYLNNLRAVTQFQTDNVRQWTLVCGWAVTNICQAAEIIDYHDSAFEDFLRLCYWQMESQTNSNWQASFADSRLAVAAYLGDAAMWDDAKRYFDERIAQNFYHSSYDAGHIKPLHVEDSTWPIPPDGIVNATTVPSGPPGFIHTGTASNSLSHTQSHWGQTWDTTNSPKIGLCNSDYTPNTTLGPIVDGVNSEALRDLSHVTFSLAAWMHGCRTILAQGDLLSQHAYDRLLSGYSYHGTRCLEFLTTGNISPPTPTEDLSGGTAYQRGWYGAAKLFLASTPASVTGMLARSEVKNIGAAGALHMCAEQFADG